ncbi:hypothetical protein OZX67_03065 [Bifidobacterium sp. ESL0728]|uniref:phosphatase domain-containing protein n=1 Tax=Bifidobacterium sp. ESL0728 TaxID=2983220 RepID=UPI0023F7FC0C|nr:hypothetical protein [Bifidobacterium sp. ESL0728]WEV59540.1 hypothetical protein OZX67_03065 [Bifidobacterium sp. ESL0728]
MKKHCQPCNISVKQEIPDAYIFDIDGTLAHRLDRNPYDDLAAGDDVPDIPVLRTLCHLQDAGCLIVLVSGRKERSRSVLVTWLKNYLGDGRTANIDKLFMRANDDNRKDSTIKEEIYLNSIKDNYNVCAVFDDRNQVVEMWRRIGLKCFQVESGNF